MRRHVFVLALSFLLAACSPGAVAPPGGAPEPAPASLPAPGQMERPAPRAEDLRVQPALAVRTVRAARVYTGRGPWYLLVAELPGGTDVDFLESREGWLRIRMTSGESGWLASADVQMEDARGQVLAYQLKPGRSELKHASGLQVEVVRPAAGIVRVNVSGLPGQAEVAETTGGSVAVMAPLGAGLQGALPVGDSGVGVVSVTERGILIDLESNVLYRVTGSGEGRLELEFRPGLEKVEKTEEGWRLNVRGDLRLQLPGASGPLALYRTGPGRLELRFLAPGLKGKTVVIDPGHGGEETGAVGVAGHLEKDVNLAVALRLRTLLEQEGARVIMTRTEDDRVLTGSTAPSQSERTQLDLAARSALSNKAGADLFVSVHANGGPPGDGGIETFWALPNLNASLSRHLATFVQEELVGAFGLTDRGVKQRPFNVIRNSDAPAVLAELGFMTNRAEESLLVSAEGQQEAAGALLRGIRRYFDAP